MLIDTHIHVGQFNDLYFTPSAIHKLMEELNVDYYAVSSTTQCEENYPKVLSEMEELIRLDDNKILPIMWITPDGLNGNIAWLLESGIKWRMLKIHPFLNQTEWNPQGDLFAEVLGISQELHLPLLIHTGNEECCKASLYEQVIKKYPGTIFVLAHGRPIDSALRLAATYGNVYVDSAFMPIEHMKRFIKTNLSEKLLWGTDMCIPMYFNNKLDLALYYNSKLHTLREICTKKQYEQITYRNAIKLFRI